MKINSYFYLFLILLLSGCTSAELAIDIFKKSKREKTENNNFNILNNNMNIKPQIPENENKITKNYKNLPKENPIYKIGNPYEINSIWYYPERNLHYDETGIASWYGNKFAGKLTANGEIFNPNKVSAAHKTLPMPSMVRVTNLENGKSLIMRINDRGPFVAGRIIDLSRKAAELLSFKDKGIARVRVQILPEQSLRLEKMAIQGVFPNLKKEDIKLPQVNITKKPSVSLKAKTTRALTIKPVAKKTAIQLIEEAKTPKVILTNPVKTNIWIQVGAFYNKINAENVLEKLVNLNKGQISEFINDGKILHRVRLGPILTVEEADKILLSIFNKGFDGARIIVD